MMNNDIERVLFTETEISETVKRLGAEISRDYEGKNLLLVGILKGSVVFMSDIMREITVPCRIDFMIASSYGSGAVTSGKVNIVKDLDLELDGYDVLIIEDILDSGITLDHIVKHLKEKHPNSVKTCTLLDKKERRKTEFDADYVGMSVPNEFIVGYGLDYDEKYRNIPYIGILKPEIYQQ